MERTWYAGAAAQQGSWVGHSGAILQIPEPQSAASRQGARSVSCSSPRPCSSVKVHPAGLYAAVVPVRDSSNTCPSAVTAMFSA